MTRNNGDLMRELLELKIDAGDKEVPPVATSSSSSEEYIDGESEAIKTVSDEEPDKPVESDKLVVELPRPDLDPRRWGKNMTCSPRRNDTVTFVERGQRGVLYPQ